MTVADDYYATLGVSPEAGGPVIRAAYRALMRRYHPDVNASGDADLRAKAINEAYACLRDGSKRASYDRLRAAPAEFDPIPAAAPSPRRAPPPIWPGPRDNQLAAALLFQPSWWKAALLGAATIVTIVTFTLTSATPPRDPAAPPPAPTQRP